MSFYNLLYHIDCHVKENLEDLEMDPEQKNLISREIRIFRETYKVMVYIIQTSCQ